MSRGLPSDDINGRVRGVLATWVATQETTSSALLQEDHGESGTGAETVVTSTSASAWAATESLRS